MTEAAPVGVTVLLPVHGEAPFLQEAIQSTLSQTLDCDWELLVVFDRPDPSVRSEVLSTSDTRIRTVDAQGVGLVAALNTGLRQAKYPLLARMDADDVMLPGRLTAQRNYLVSHAGVGVVGTQVEVIGASGELLGVRKYPSLPVWVTVLMTFKNCLAHPSVMFWLQVAVNAGGYRIQFTGAEDYDLWLRIRRVAKIRNLASMGLRYRVHEGQVTRSQKRQVIDATLAVQTSALSLDGRGLAARGMALVGRSGCLAIWLTRRLRLRLSASRGLV